MEVWGTPIVSTVEDIIETLQIQIRAQGVDLLRDIKPTTGNLMVTCISHSGGTERKPSMGISTSDVIRNGKKTPAGTCNCFTCGYTADLPNFISACFGYNDGGMFGYKWLTQNFVNLSIDERKPLVLNMERDTKTKQEEIIIPDEEMEQYRYTHSYMYRRKLTDKVIEYFDVGYDREQEALTFPVHNLNGDVVLIQRRAVGRKQFINDTGGNKSEYIYGLYQLYKNLSWAETVYITESPIDALTLWTHRIPAVATMGIRISETQIRLLRELPLRKLVIAFDNDEAGELGKKKLKEKLGMEKLLYAIQFPEGVKDVNDMTDEQISNHEITLF